MISAHDFIFQGDQRVGDFDSLYQQIPDPWSQLTNIDSILNKLLLQLLEHLESNEGPKRTILDVGCGLGAFTGQLFKVFSRAAITGIDISQTAIVKASNRIRNAAFVQVDIRNTNSIESGLGITTPYFDLVLVKNLFWYVLPELPEVLQNIKTLMKKQGDLVIAQYFPQPEEQRYGREYMVNPGDLIPYLDEAGFEIVHTVELNRLTNYVWVGWLTNV